MMIKPLIKHHFFQQQKRQELLQSNQIIPNESLPARTSEIPESIKIPLCAYIEEEVPLTAEEMGILEPQNKTENGAFLGPVNFSF